MVAIRGRGGIHIHTVGVRKCRFLYNASHGDVKCYARRWLTSQFMYTAYGNLTAHTVM